LRLTTDGHKALRGLSATFYWWAILTIALSCTIFKLFDVK